MLTDHSKQQLDQSTQQKLPQNPFKTSPRPNIFQANESRFREDRQNRSRNLGKGSIDLTNEELKQIKRSLDPNSGNRRPNSILYLKQNTEQQLSNMHNQDQVTEGRGSILNLNQSVASINMSKLYDNQSQNTNTLQTQRETIQEQKKIFTKIEETNNQNNQIKMLYRSEHSNDNLFDQQQQQLQSHQQNYHDTSFSNLDDSGIIFQNIQTEQSLLKDSRLVEDVNNQINYLNINDQSRNLSLNKSRLLSQDLKKYHFSIDAFNDKIVMEKQNLQQSPSVSRIEISKLSLHHPNELKGRISNITNTQRLQDLRNYIDYHEPNGTELIKLIEKRANKSVPRERLNEYRQIISYAQKPKFSGNADFKFNKIDFESFILALEQIKFFDDLESKAQLEKFRKQFIELNLMEFQVMSDQELKLLKTVRDKYNSLLKIKPQTKIAGRRQSKIIEEINSINSDKIIVCYHESKENLNSDMPNARTNSKIVNLDNHKLVLFGGIGNNILNDLRVYDFHEQKWRLLEQLNEDKNDLPMPRFGHSLESYKAKLILYGGAGHYIESLKCRFTHSDLRMFDKNTQKWDEKDYSKDEGMGGKKRMNHSSAVFGSMLVVYGGLYAEENKLMNDVSVFDLGNLCLQQFLEINKWLNGGVNSYIDSEKGLVKIHQKLIKNPLPKLQMHTMTTFYNLDLNQQMRESRRLWDLPPELYQQNSQVKFNYGGMLVFGGINEKKQIKDELWLIEPNQSSNKSDVYASNGAYLNLDFDTEIYVTARKLSPMGKGPCPRYGHSACLIKGLYLCVFGGRNDTIMKDGINPILNDLNLFDFVNNTWITLVLFGSQLMGRTLSVMGALNGDKLLIFGGTDLRAFCQSKTLTFVDFNEKSIGYNLSLIKKTVDKIDKQINYT
ncbi:kelch motif family protein [Stylonychia lemnae]|uniref:Kelch motif family protein n=1 Tax=Stylonychia lemnae TaxID=5949 RepID=A0A077ZV36_STYLE|nr:kelch motif family protein [Stylonychia lemnae]|eukprot:CDW73755.1 kelch motif family protein [Stylonychia lemnae]